MNARICRPLVLLIAIGCGESSSGADDETPVPEECGGCALPPPCGPDGTAPDPVPRCSCGCFEGQQVGGGVCNENGCIVMSETSSIAPPQCGGCALPPTCGPDGTAPSAPCSCGCFEGQQLGGGVCNENGCIVMSETPDADIADAGATDAGAMDSDAGRLTCTGEAATPPADTIVAPSTDDWNAAVDELSAEGDGTSLPATIDPATCAEGKWAAALPLGSAYVHVHQRADGDCELWLGGETENPAYDGSPTQYCRFPSSCLPVVPQHGIGGPASIDSPYCTGS